MTPLEQVDPEIAKAIRAETERQSRNLELIASENFVSEAVLEAVGSVMTNKYAEGYPGKRYYGGCEIVDIAEELAISRARELFGAEHVNVQPHSGSQANMAVYFTLLKPGDVVLGPNLAHGGHLTAGSPINFSGRLYQIVPYGVRKDTERIDLDVRGTTRVLGPFGLAGLRHVSDAIDPAIVAAVLEEAEHGIGRVRVRHVAVRLDELVPVLETRRNVHRPLLRGAHEPRNARVRDRQRWRRHRVERLIDARCSRICGRSHAHGQLPSSSLASSGFVDLAIDSRDFAKPHVTLFVFHVEDVVDGPVKVVRDVRHFLVKLLTRVRGDRRPVHPGPDWPLPPSSASTAPVTMSMSISCWHFGHVT